MNRRLTCMWDGWIPVTFSLARSEPQVQKLQAAVKLSLQRSEAIALYISTSWRTDDRHTMFGDCYSFERGFKSWGSCRIYYYTHCKTYTLKNRWQTMFGAMLLQFWARLKVFNEVRLLLYILLYTLKNRWQTMFRDCCSFERVFKPNSYIAKTSFRAPMCLVPNLYPPKKKATPQDRDNCRLSTVNDWVRSHPFPLSFLNKRRLGGSPLKSQRHEIELWWCWLGGYKGRGADPGY